ncbi:MAG: ABC transporter ATP-binding protein [Alphaproteobacteria bacterium]|nr:ABC transporter ATP-binding protein [Alphaproteobacteria bacterium]
MTPRLRARGVSRRFGALVAVDGVELDVMSGEVHAVIGPNGAGKSTLLGILAGEVRPDAGEIFLDGQRVTGLDTARRARLGMARSFQVTAIVQDLTALQNAMLAVIAAERGRIPGLGRPAMADPTLLAAAREALRAVGIEGAADVAAGSLAHGAQRQLELAMALVGRPRVLLLDEPTAGTGPDEGRAMIELLRRVKTTPGGGPSMVLVEHDLDAVFALADRITVMAQGRVIACGPPEAVRTDPLVRAAYLGDAHR